MRPLVIVQNNFVQRLTAPMALAAREIGVAVHDVSSGDEARRRPLPENDETWSPILVIGSILFVHQWAREEAALAPWVFWDDAQYDAALWAKQIGTRYLNSDGLETTIREFQGSDSTARHIRPRSGMKLVGEKVPTESEGGQSSIAGLVATPQEIQALNIDPNTAIWTAPPKSIDGEVRVWMIGGRAVAASTYRVNGAHERTVEHPFIEQAISAALECHEIWRPGKHYVVDIAITGNEPKVIEYNPIHSSGWYAVNPGAVLDAYITAETSHAKPTSTRALRL